MNNVGNLGFEEAIEETNLLLRRIEDHAIEDNAAEAAVASIVSSVAGARGFLVSYLTGEFAIAEEHPEPIVKGLKQASSTVSDLVAKNIVMSSAMALTHRRNGATSHYTGSMKVTRRSQSLSLRLGDAATMRRLSVMSMALADAVKDGGITGQESAGEELSQYTSFLKRWNYDLEQLQSAQAAVTHALKNM